MRRSDLLRLGAVVVPPLVLAAAGLAHPMTLTDDTASMWRGMHLALLPVFPLLGFAPWLVVRRDQPALAPVAAVLGYVYAVFYTALDVLAGIGAGALWQAGATAQAPVLFRNGNDLAWYGVWAFLAATVLAVVVALRRHGRAALPGALVVLGAAVSFLDSHIYWPRGVLTMLALAVGWAALTVLPPMSPGPRRRPTVSGVTREEP